MALPPRAAAVYVLLSKPSTTPFTVRDTGTQVTSYVAMDSTPGQEPIPPEQPSFWASQVWYKDYPGEDVAKVHLGLLNASYPWQYAYEINVGAQGNRIYLDKFTNNQVLDVTYPANIVYQYDPTTPSPADPVPDPNGTVGTNTITRTSPNGPGYFYLPRWQATDPAYDVGNDQIALGLISPEFDTEYFINENGFFGNSSPYYQQFGAWSVDLTVDNYQSEVFNQQTSSYEYYDFTQATFDYKHTTTVKLYLDANVCCWNKGTVITGTVKFQSIGVETTALGRTVTVNPDPSYSYGFAGMIAKTGSTASDAGSSSFTVNITSSYTPVEIEVPTLAGTITFINDFSIDSVTPPA